MNNVGNKFRFNDQLFLLNSHISIIQEIDCRCLYYISNEKR